MKTINASPLEHAIDLLLHWMQLKRHDIRPVKRLSDIEWMTICDRCGQEYHITKNGDNYVMNLDDQSCARKRLPTST
jgi:hypothetical protein